MSSKSNRLPHNVFTRVFRAGKRIQCEDLLLIVSPNSQSVSRFAVQVGVKIDKRATRRNRMKRLIREAIRHLLPSLKSGFDCIVIANSNLSEYKQQDVEKMLIELYSRPGLAVLQDQVL